MKKATAVGVFVTTAFYMLCGILGYIAFGNDAPGNFLAGFGYFKPAWIVDFANACIVVHLVGAYQVNSLSNKLVHHRNFVSFLLNRALVWMIRRSLLNQSIGKWRTGVKRSGQKATL